MKLNEPTVGPIIGYTTANQSRIFVRGQLERVESGFRRCFAVIRWRRLNRNKGWSEPLFNKLSPNFDMTGVLVLDGLSPDTDYEYQVGWFFAEAELDNVKALTEADIEWPASRHFRTSVSNKRAARSFVVGSCRYLLRLFGGTFYDDRGDKVFRSVLEQISKKNMPVHGLLMIGDQIYADDLNFVSPDTRLDQFLERYRIVFQQEYVKELMGQVPTYMILDDHEIEDNWPSKATDRDRITLYPHAIHAYQIYQCSHSPLFDKVVDGRIDGTLSHFWYKFSDGCSDWFVMDTRTERILSESGNRLINDEQMDALLSWLTDKSGRVKFVVSSVPMFPDLSIDSDDKWSAFPTQRTKILEHIRSNGVRKVIFISGDVHCSFCSKLTTESDPDFLVYSVVSSSFFWPYPHTSQGDFLFGEQLSDTGETEYRTDLIGDVFSTDNFARIDVAPHEVLVTYYERKGDQLGQTVKLPLR